MFRELTKFKHEKIVHGFFGRKGGVSEGVYANLNCGPGSGDDLEKVAENRKLVRNALGLQNLSTSYQCHSAICNIITAPFTDKLEGDALVTNVAGVGLGILTADCGPVMFHGQSANGMVIGAAHAGWGGAVKGVLENTIAKMIELGADLSSIHAGIGPCIAQASYEVGADFQKPFLEDDKDAAQFFKDGQAGKLQFDLAGYIAFRLKRAGVEHIEDIKIDTYAHEDDYFSFRRATHRGEAQYGREISVISIKE